MNEHKLHVKEEGGESNKSGGFEKTEQHKTSIVFSPGDIFISFFSFHCESDNLITCFRREIRSRIIIFYTNHKSSKL